MQSSPEVGRHYVGEKIDAMMDMEKPEQLLDNANCATFHQLVKDSSAAVVVLDDQEMEEVDSVMALL